MSRQQKMIAITLAPSQPLFFLYGLLGVFTSACLQFIPMPVWGMIVLVMMVWCFCAYVMLLHALLRLPKSWIGLRLNAKNQWFAQNKQGEEVEVNITPDTFVSSFLTVINLQDKKAKPLGSMLIIPSRVDKATYRQLRVLLLWGSDRKNIQSDSLDA